MAPRMGFSTSLRNHSVRSGVVIRDASPMLKGQQYWAVGIVYKHIKEGRYHQLCSGYGLLITSYLRCTSKCSPQKPMFDTTLTTCFVLRLTQTGRGCRSGLSHHSLDIPNLQNVTGFQVRVHSWMALDSGQVVPNGPQSIPLGLQASY